ncbi:MAG: GNAT family N-acetyltransferase [candidate division Zixibacteria bacterium]|nr:GNAT family N-acetyltransferase [candidate division Zixibacteria bacterium]MDD5425087.1 GNAT family N-acetyltransferase [candidate division Zixibacteria bacterium]
MKNNIDNLDISLMTNADLEFAVKMTDDERWGYLPTDFEKLMAFEPEGCFVARVDNRYAGIITTTSYADYAFVGSLIVNPVYRGKMIGEQLLSQAMAYLKNRGVKTIELDGVFAAVSLYRRLGFRDKYLSLRFFRPAGKIVRAGKIALSEPSREIIEFDRKHTNIERTRILERYLREYRDSTYIVQDPFLSGYAFVRPRAEGKLMVGPMVALSSKTAGLLWNAIMTAYAKYVLGVGVPEHNRTMIRLLNKSGFYYNSPSLRMFWGKKKEYEKNIYGILSPEKG